MRLVATRLAGTMVIVALAAAVGNASVSLAGSGTSVLPNPDQQTQQGGQVGPPILQVLHGSQVQALHREEVRKQAAASYTPPAGATISTAPFNVYTGTTHPGVGSPPTAKEPSDGFDYGDAAIGAGLAAAITLLVSAGIVVLRRRGQLQHG
jgi:hypothetical protein